MIQPGTLLQNRYRVAEQVGKGGMGEVYIAKDERFQSAVAIKRNFLDDPEMSKAFRREARLLNHLRHAALPKVSDHFTEGGGHFLVMEFIEGSDLAELMKQRKVPFPLSDVLRWADELLDALDYLHTQEPPVVHRDIKPPNIKLTARGKIVLLDFGLAKGAPSQTAAGGAASSVHGYSLNFAPLEQMEGSGTCPRSDLYSLAATLYFLLTGVRPPDAVARAIAAIKGQPDPLRPAHLVQAQVPAAVGQILQRAMSQNSALRHASAAELRNALRLAGNDIARREARLPAASAKLLPQSLPSPPKGTAEEATLRTNFPGQSTAQDLTQSSKLSHNLYPSSSSGGEAAARIDSRRQPHISDSETISARAASASRDTQANRSKVLLACFLVISAAVGAYLFARPSASSVPTARDNVGAQVSAPSSQEIAPTPQPVSGAVSSDSSQAAPISNAPSQSVSAQAADETTYSSQPSAETASAPETGGTNTKGNATTTVSPNTDGASSTGRTGLVIQNPAPAPRPVDETRRAEEARREQTAYPPEYSNRPPPGAAYPPPPGGRRPPPPDGRRPPPPHFRPPYP